MKICFVFRVKKANQYGLLFFLPRVLATSSDDVFSPRGSLLLAPSHLEKCVKALADSAWIAIGIKLKNYRPSLER